jgi:hypothetical protein
MNLRDFLLEKEAGDPEREAAELAARIERLEKDIRLDLGLAVEALAGKGDFASAVRRIRGSLGKLEEINGRLSGRD